MAQRGINYGRNYQLDFSPDDKSGESFRFIQTGLSDSAGTPAGISSVQLMRGIALQFTISAKMPKDRSTTDLKCSLRLYNVTAATARGLQVSGSFVLQLGYAGIISPVFVGHLVTASTGQEGNDSYIEMELTSGNVYYGDRFFSRTYKQPTTLIQVVRDLVTFLELKKAPTQDITNQGGVFDLLPSDDRPIGKRTIQGDASKILAAILPTKYIYVSSNHTVNIVDRVLNPNLAAGANGIRFNPSTGQLGYLNYTGQVTSHNNNQIISQVSARSIFNQDIILNALIRVDVGTRNPDAGLSTATINSLTAEGPFDYRVTEYVHSGNTFKGEMTTNWVGELLDTTQAINKPRVGG